MARVLLLETDRIIAKNIIDIFGNDGHQVDWQVEPQEAIHSIDTTPVDMIVMDLVLAGRSGIEFLYELRSYPEWQKMPVIIYSNVPAHDFMGYMDAFELLNISAYRYKPTTSLKELLELTKNSLVSV